MKINNKKILAARAVALLFFLYACFYMYDFYKSLSGFIANGFREPIIMLPMIVSFFLPVLCFLFFIYDFYVKKIKRSIKIIYSVFVIIYAAVNLAFIFLNIKLYASNNSLGVYSSLPSIVIHFPYDMIVLLSLILLWNVYSLWQLFKGKGAVSDFLDSLNERGALKLCIAEYLILSVFAIVIFVFSGSGIYALFSSLENAFYDARYIYLVLWVALIPLGNLIIAAIKPEKMNIRKSAKIIILSAGIAVNVIFGILFLIFEKTNPDFLIHIGKPLFLITFSISLPIEPLIIFAVMALGSILMAIRFVKSLMAEK